MVAVRKDTLPEGTRYEDSGCRIAPSCLNCPRAQCIYDLPESVDNKVERDREIVRLRKEGVPPSEIARAFGISTRVVHRTLQRGGPSEWALTYGVSHPEPEDEPRAPRQPVYRQRKPWPRLQVAQ